MNDLNQFETHMDRMEREAQAQRASLAIEQEKTKRAKIEARREWTEAFAFIGVAFVVSALILSVLVLWHVAVRGPGAEEVQRQEHIQMCYERGGAWVPKTGNWGDDNYVDEHCSLGGGE